MENIIREINNLKMNKEYGKVYELASEAFKANPNNYRLLNNMAFAKYMTKDYKKALELYEKLLNIVPNDYKYYHNIYFNLANIYDKLNYKNKALDAYNKVLEYKDELVYKALLTSYAATINTELGIKYYEELLNDIKHGKYTVDKEDLQDYEMSLANLYYLYAKQLFVEFPNDEFVLVDEENAKKALKIASKAINLKNITPEAERDLKYLFNIAKWSNDKHWDFKSSYRKMSDMIFSAFLIVVIVIALLASKSFIGFLIGIIFIYMFAQNTFMVGKSMKMTIA